MTEGCSRSDLHCHVLGIPVGPFCEVDFVVVDVGDGYSTAYILDVGIHAESRMSRSETSHVWVAVQDLQDLPMFNVQLDAQDHPLVCMTCRDNRSKYNNSICINLFQNITGVSSKALDQLIPEGGE